MVHYTLSIVHCLLLQTTRAVLTHDTAGLLTRFLCYTFPLELSNSGYIITKCTKALIKTHSSGTVRDLHPIPF